MECGPWAERGRMLLVWPRHRVGAGDECAQNLPSVPRVGSILWVDPVGLRWTRDKSQRLFTCGRRLGDVVTDTCRGILLPFVLRMHEIDRWESKWYSRNNRRLGCLREAAVNRGAGPRGLDRSCFSAWVDNTHGWSRCGLLPADCVQGVRQGVCQPHKGAQPQLLEDV